MTNAYQDEIFNRKSKKSFKYYQTVLTLILDGLEARKTHAQIADQLNSFAILTSSGKRWSALNVQVQITRLNDPTHSGWLLDAFERMQELNQVSAQALAALRAKRRIKTAA